MVFTTISIANRTLEIIQNVKNSKIIFFYKPVIYLLGVANTHQQESHKFHYLFWTSAITDTDYSFNYNLIKQLKKENVVWFNDFGK